MSAGFGDLLKKWRNLRRFSQLSLSVETGLSSRHISFLETGRSRPSRGSVLTLSRALDMPKPAVNDALLAAGFAPEYPAHDLSDVSVQPMLDALDMIIKNHAPFPAIVIDEDWQIVGGNVPAMGMMQLLPFNGSRCVVDALLNDDIETPIFTNWEVIAAWSLTRLQLETSRLGYDGPLTEVYNRLLSDPRSEGIDTSFQAAEPFLTMNARVDGHTLSLFTMLAEFTSAQDIGLSARRVELFFAADDATRRYFEALEY